MSSNPQSHENSPAGDTGLNFVLQNAVAHESNGNPDQFSGLAVLGKLLHNTTSNQSQSHESEHHLLHQHQHQQNHEQRSAEASHRENEEMASTQRTSDIPRDDQSQQQHEQDQIVSLHKGTGSFSGGHFTFHNTQAATGQGLHRVLIFANKVTPTTNNLIPQIAPHLAQGGNNAMRKKSSNASSADASSPNSNNANKKLEKLVKLQNEYEENYKKYSTSSSDPNKLKSASGDGGKDGEGGAAVTAAYKPYCPRSMVGGSSNKHKIASAHNNNNNNSDSSSSPSRGVDASSPSHQQKHHNFVSAGNDLFGLHCIFEACKDLVSEHPKMLPRLRIAGVQREVDDVSASSGGANSAAAAVATTSVSNNETHDQTLSPSSFNPKTKQQSSHILHHHVSGYGTHHHQTKELVNWLVPWPFELEDNNNALNDVDEEATSLTTTGDANKEDIPRVSKRSAKKSAGTSAATFNQQVERFNPISPIFNEPAISQDSIAHHVVLSARAAAREEERQLQIAQSQQEAEDQAHRLALALHESHTQHEKHNDAEGIDGSDTSSPAKNAPQDKPQHHDLKTSLSSSSPRNNHNNHKKVVVGAKSGFLPRSFQVAAIPSVLPSLLTVTGARNTTVSQQHNGQQVRTLSSAIGSEDNSGGVAWEQEKGKHDALTATGNGTNTINNNNNTARSLQTFGNNTKRSDDPSTSARMRNRAKNWSNTMSSVGMLVPSCLTNNSSFPKHKDVKKIESKTDKLRSELEHFKTMRSIRSGHQPHDIISEYNDGSSNNNTLNISPRDAFRQHMWSNNGNNNSNTTTNNNNNGTRPKTPPKSFLASHGLRSPLATDAISGSLPPIHQQNNNNNNNNNASRGLESGGGINATIVTNHPSVPWSRNIATGSSSLSARFTSGKYQQPDRVNLVNALMD